MGAPRRRRRVDAITDRRDGGEGDTGTGDLRGPEWEAFTAAVPPKSGEFEVRALDVPSGFRKTLDHPIAVDRLREVQALCGFTRLDGPDAAEPARIAPIWKSPQPWLPRRRGARRGILIPTSPSAVETVGEGTGQRRLPDLRQQPGTGDPPRARSRRRDAARPFVRCTPCRTCCCTSRLECGYSTASSGAALTAASPATPRVADGSVRCTRHPRLGGNLGGLAPVRADPAGRLCEMREPTIACSTTHCADTTPGTLRRHTPQRRVPRLPVRTRDVLRGRQPLPRPRSGGPDPRPPRERLLHMTDPATDATADAVSGAAVDAAVGGAADVVASAVVDAADVVTGAPRRSMQVPATCWQRVPQQSRTHPVGRRSLSPH